MSMFQFSMREWFLVCLVIALALSWWIEML